MRALHTMAGRRLDDGRALAVAWIVGPSEAAPGARVALRVESSLGGDVDALWMGPGLDEGPAREVELAVPDAEGRVQVRARVRGRVEGRREIVIATHTLEVKREA